MTRASFDSDVYPYERVQPGFNRLMGSEKIPYQIVR